MDQQFEVVELQETSRDRGRFRRLIGALRGIHFILRHSRFIIASFEADHAKCSTEIYFTGIATESYGPFLCEVGDALSGGSDSLDEAKRILGEH